MPDDVKAFLGHLTKEGELVPMYSGSAKKTYELMSSNNYAVSPLSTPFPIHYLNRDKESYDHV